MRRWLLIISGITGSVALGGASIFTIAHLQNSNKGALSSSTQVTQPSYQFAYLADQCKQGINNFQQQMDSLKSKEKTVNDDTQQQVASIKSDADMAIAYDTQQSSKFLEESTQPGISAEEENALVQTAQNFSNDSTQRQNSSEQAQLAVLQNAKEQIDKITSEEQAANDGEARLLSCVDSVNKQEEFSPSDLSNVQSLITQSNTKY